MIDHTTELTVPAFEEPHQDMDSVDVFGFWLYILTDCIIFGCLFAVFATFHFQGMEPSPLKQYINLKDVLFETFLLLTSSFTFCLASFNLHKKKFLHVQWWLLITMLLGIGFIFIEFREFVSLTHEGFSWLTSAHASSFFTLVGCHGLHVSAGIIWMFIMMLQLPIMKQAPHIAIRRMTYLGLFWNFLDIVWIFLFTVVYLTGAI